MALPAIRVEQDRRASLLTLFMPAGVAAVIGVFLGLYTAWWLAGAGASLYSPYATSADDLDMAALVSLGASAAVLCPCSGGSVGGSL